MNFAEYIYYLAHRIFKRKPGEGSDIDKYSRAIGPSYDGALEVIFLLREQALVATATGAALDALGKERGIPRHLNEEDDPYRSRLLSAYKIHNSDGTPGRMMELLRLMGYPVSEVYELFKDGLIIPFFNGQNAYDGSIAHGGGLRWAEFRVRLGMMENSSFSPFRSFTLEDKKLVLKTINQSKPAHTRLVELLLELGFEDRCFLGEAVLALLNLVSGEPFLRAGLRHSGQAQYQKVLVRNAGVLYNSNALHNRLMPGELILHRCEDESSSLQALAQLADAPRLFALHNGWQRLLGLRYTGAAALDQAAAAASLRLADAAPQTVDAIEPVSRLNLAEHFAGETLAHGVLPWPQRTGAVLYRSRYSHRPRTPRDGRSIYGDHLPRFLGPRRDGRHRYGGTLQEKLEAFDAKILLQDEPVTQLSGRDGHFFYRDKIYHGPCPAPVEAPGYALSLREADNFILPEDQVTGRANVVVTGDIYPGSVPVHGSPGQPLHDGSTDHKYAGNYGWRGDRYNGQRYHGKAPVDGQETAVTKLFLYDKATGRHLYGGDRLRHDGGGLRWKHHGMLLRRPFARHDLLWLRDGARRYLEARARYGDLAVMHDGIEHYGVSGGVHDGTVLRQPAAPPEDLAIIARRGYRRVAA